MTTAAKILSQKSHLVPGKLRVTEWLFEVPKDYSKPGGESIRLFARSAEKSEKGAVDVSKDEKKKDLPWFLYLQGGPGMACRPYYGGAYGSIIEKGYKLLLLDQRGTGMSSTITAESLQKLGGTEEQVAHLKLFRADNIVRDAEAIRHALTADYPEEKKKWSILGQSFGGFCSVNYLSRFPGGLREVFLTGGLPPLVKQPDPIYERLFKRAADRSRQFYEKFPEDVGRMQEIARYLSKNEVKTFTGGKVSPARLRGMGMFLGFHTGFELVHNLILRMANDLEMLGYLSRPTITSFDANGPFDATILYALLHEPCYTHGTAANWSADRMMKKFPEFESLNGDREEPILFTAEMILPSIFGDYQSLEATHETANALAKVSDWPELYDEAQLARNEVPVYAATFYDDLYVDFDYAQETAGKIKGCKVYITNTMYHDGMGSKSDELIKELFAMRDDVRD